MVMKTGLACLVLPSPCSRPPRVAVRVSSQAEDTAATVTAGEHALADEAAELSLRLRVADEGNELFQEQLAAVAAPSRAARP